MPKLFDFLGLFWSCEKYHIPIPLRRTLAPLREEYMSGTQKKYALIVSMMRGHEELMSIHNTVKKARASLLAHLTEDEIEFKN